MNHFRVVEMRDGSFAVQAHALGKWRQNGPNEACFEVAKLRAEELQLAALSHEVRRPVFWPSKRA